jgi:hypothetical protein
MDTDRLDGDELTGAASVAAGARVGVDMPETLPGYFPLCQPYPIGLLGYETAIDTTGFHDAT